MVEAALQEKGWDAGPAELQPVIFEKFKVELDNNVISNYKSVLKREGGKTGGAKRGRKPGPEFADLQAVRGLVSKLGADQKSEEHTSELQSRLHLVCRLLLEKKKNHSHYHHA